MNLAAFMAIGLMGIAQFLPTSCMAADITAAQPQDLVTADDERIQYTGRVDFTDPKRPKFWAPGVYIKAKFKGTYCSVVVNDEILWGKSHNYLEIAVDDQAPFRVQTTGPANTIKAAEGLPDGEHTVTICKDTEAGIGYLELVGFRCAGLAPLPDQPSRRMEFIGDSITCGAGSDHSTTPCGKGEWYDQHNAYMSYGATAARLLNAQWQLTSVSGIGMVHSCCDMKVAMPDVFNALDLQEHGRLWDFNRYQPDVVTVCLGQNDGAQDAVKFRDKYAGFIRILRSYYPKAQIVCLTSPMADQGLTAFLKENLSAIVKRANENGDRNVHTFFFSHSYNGGCGGHPSTSDHAAIAEELTRYIKMLMTW